MRPPERGGHENNGNVLITTGKYEEALVQFQKGLDVLVFIHGQQHPSVAEPETRENMAVIYADQGKYIQAFEVYKSVLETLIHACGPDSLNVATSKYKKDSRRFGRPGGAQVISRVPRCLAQIIR